jgi:hypothetical protein
LPRKEAALLSNDALASSNHLTALKLDDAIARNQEINILEIYIMHIIETLDKLLKNELSATETYKQTLDILREDAELGDAVYLMPIYEDHEDHKVAVSSLQTQIRQLGGTPAEDSGAWGTWAKIVMGGR